MEYRMNLFMDLARSIPVNLHRHPEHPVEYEV